MLRDSSYSADHCGQAVTREQEDNMLYAIVPIIAVVVLVIAAVSCLILKSYVKAPPDTAFIITGAGRKKILIGNAGI